MDDWHDSLRRRAAALKIEPLESASETGSAVATMQGHAEQPQRPQMDAPRAVARAPRYSPTLADRVADALAAAGPEGLRARALVEQVRGHQRPSGAGPWIT